MAEFLEYLALIVCSVYEWYNMHGITSQPNLERFILKKLVILSGLFLCDRKQPQESTEIQGNTIYKKEPARKRP